MIVTSKQDINGRTIKVRNRYESLKPTMNPYAMEIVFADTDEMIANIVRVEIDIDENGVKIRLHCEIPGTQEIHCVEVDDVELAIPERQISATMESTLA